MTQKIYSSRFTIVIPNEAKNLLEPKANCPFRKIDSLLRSA